MVRQIRKQLFCHYVVWNICKCWGKCWGIVDPKNFKGVFDPVPGGFRTWGHFHSIRNPIWDPKMGQGFPLQRRSIVEMTKGHLIVFCKLKIFNLQSGSLKIIMDPKHQHYGSWFYSSAHDIIIISWYLMIPWTQHWLVWLFSFIDWLMNLWHWHAISWKCVFLKYSKVRLLGFFPKNQPNKIFPEKSGSVTF